MTTTQQVRTEITLKGSTQIVSEFFGYAINTILYLRGIYQPEAFESCSKYGVPMMIARDPGLNKYLGTVLQQVATLLMQGSIQKLAIAISSPSGETIERWDFDVDHESCGGKSQHIEGDSVTNDIRALVRQITSSVSFLPNISSPCTFDVLVYADPDVKIPADWDCSDGLSYIPSRADTVALRSFNTKIHKVSGSIQFRGEHL
eukprot:gnl/Chilomastix_caulleri/885.p1 GENE.gnl/Chilomastix_caulleri/885~~gnl/Chilomastix_caulleri/885.p1  ORF type:complete len:203 (+),score=43.68 gnl/Chilomastix_caulleri/885:88-696(+)